MAKRHVHTHRPVKKAKQPWVAADPRLFHRTSKRRLGRRWLWRMFQSPSLTTCYGSWRRNHAASSMYATRNPQHADCSNCLRINTPSIHTVKNLLVTQSKSVKGEFARLWGVTKPLRTRATSGKSISGIDDEIFARILYRWPFCCASHCSGGYV